MEPLGGIFAFGHTKPMFRLAVWPNLRFAHCKNFIFALLLSCRPLLHIRHNLQRMNRFGQADLLLCRKMAEQIDKWDERLFADPIKADTPRGTVIIHPQRTNNILEQFFRRMRRGRRRSFRFTSGRGTIL